MIVTCCQFCNLQMGTQQFCPARMLIPGERFPCESNTPGTRMIRDLAKQIDVRGRFGRSKKRR